MTKRLTRMALPMRCYPDGGGRHHCRRHGRDRAQEFISDRLCAVPRGRTRSGLYWYVGAGVIAFVGAAVVGAAAYTTVSGGRTSTAIVAVVSGSSQTPPARTASAIAATPTLTGDAVAFTLAPNGSGIGYGGVSNARGYHRRRLRPAGCRHDGAGRLGRDASRCRDANATGAGGDRRRGANHAATGDEYAEGSRYAEGC